MTIVSFSEVYKWDTCQRAYYYRFVLGLKPEEETEAITTGTKGHRLLQSFYTLIEEGKTRDEALELVRASAARMIKHESITEMKALLNAWTLVDNYIRTIDVLPKAALVENRFLLPVAGTLSLDPIFDDVVIGFTPDVVFKRGEFYDVEDSKFVQRAWSKSKLDMFPQAKLYQVFLRRMGYNVSRSSIRFFNVATAKITEYHDTLDLAEEVNIVNDFLGGVREVLNYRSLSDDDKERTRRTMNYGACQFCAFNYPCKLQKQGKDASKTLQHLYVKSDYDYNT